MPRIVNRRYNKNEGEELDNIIHVSYDDFVRLERRNLLLVASLTLLSKFSGIDPASGSIFGFTFNHLSDKTYYSILMAIILYFIFAFTVYGFSGYKNSFKLKSKIVSSSMNISFRVKLFSFESLNFWHEIRFYSWLFLHYLLPFLLGIFALCVATYKII